MKPRLVLLLVAIALWFSGQGAYIHAKAGVAQILLARAWAETRAGTERARPWPWADTFPVGRLRVPAHGIDQIILAGTTGRTLAFAPGLIDGTDSPGRCGHCVISGHRDTHFRFLRHLELGDEIILESADGAAQSLRVTALHVVDRADISVISDTGAPLLTLVTCYPFDAVVPGGPLRYMVWAEAG